VRENPPLIHDLNTLPVGRSHETAQELRRCKVHGHGGYQTDETQRTCPFAGVLGLGVMKFDGSFAPSVEDKDRSPCTICRARMSATTYRSTVCLGDGRHRFRVRCAVGCCPVHIRAIGLVEDASAMKYIACWKDWRGSRWFQERDLGPPHWRPNSGVLLHVG
jgi:hypothetical protein